MCMIIWWKYPLSVGLSQPASAISSLIMADWTLYRHSSDSPLKFQWHNLRHFTLGWMPRGSEWGWAGPPNLLTFTASALLLTPWLVGLIITGALTMLAVGGYGLFGLWGALLLTPWCCGNWWVWLSQVLLLRWLLVVIDCLDSEALQKLRSLYQLLFLRLNNSLLVSCCLLTQ